MAPGGGSQSPLAHSHTDGKARKGVVTSCCATDTSSVPGTCRSPINWVWAEPTPSQGPDPGQGSPRWVHQCPGRLPGVARLRNTGVCPMGARARG